MDKLKTKTEKCDYIKYNRALAEQFIHGLGEEVKISETLREVSSMEDIDDAISERVLLWAKRVEAERVQKEALHSIPSQRS